MKATDQEVLNWRSQLVNFFGWKNENYNNEIKFDRSCFNHEKAFKNKHFLGLAQQGLFANKSHILLSHFNLTL